MLVLANNYALHGWHLEFDQALQELNAFLYRTGFVLNKGGHNFSMISATIAPTG
jgi:hypothetical protein